MNYSRLKHPYICLFRGLMLAFGFLLFTRSYGQIGIGGTPHPSAVLDLKTPGNNKGLLMPRVTTTQRLTIPQPAQGLLVYDLDKAALFLYDGVNWLPLATTETANLLPIDRMALDATADDRFGYSVAISGDYAVVGAWADDADVPDQGSVYIFARVNGTWTQQAQITALDRQVGDQFGASVAISGDYLVVGAPGRLGTEGIYTVEFGTAYIFRRNGTTWTQEAQLTALDVPGLDYFGYSVSISGDYAIVGAYEKSYEGAAYIFRRNGTTWSQHTKLTVGGSGDFGRSVVISGNYALVGAPQTNSTTKDEGVVYVYVLSGNTWSRQATLSASDAQFKDEFGSSVALSGDYAVIGAPLEGVTEGLNFRGNAYVFQRNGTTWTQQAQLQAPDLAAGDSFGQSVSISGDYLMVGAPGKAGKSGAVYLYKRSGNTWPLLRKLADDAPAKTLNGTSVGLFNGQYLIGAPGWESSKGKVSFGVLD